MEGVPQTVRQCIRQQLIVGRTNRRLLPRLTEISAQQDMCYSATDSVYQCIYSVYQSKGRLHQPYLNRQLTNDHLTFKYRLTHTHTRTRAHTHASTHAGSRESDRAETSLASVRDQSQIPVGDNRASSSPSRRLW